LVLGVGVSDNFGFYLETFGDYAEFEIWNSNIDGGITYLVNDNLQLDFSAGVGLNQKMSYLSLGFSWNINTFGNRKSKL